MADFVNPETLGLVGSANDMPPPWVICTRQNLEAWSEIPLDYRKWVTDHIEEMTAPEKAAKDQQLATAVRDESAQQLNDSVNIFRNLLLVLLDEMNAHAAKINAIKAQLSVATSVADMRTRMTAIADYPARTVEQLKTAIRSKMDS